MLLYIDKWIDALVNSVLVPHGEVEWLYGELVKHLWRSNLVIHGARD
jgi:hypothetical protein